jgi:hypothetical protein
MGVIAWREGAGSTMKKQTFMGLAMLTLVSGAGCTSMVTGSEGLGNTSAASGAGGSTTSGAEGSTTSGAGGGSGGYCGITASDQVKILLLKCDPKIGDPPVVAQIDGVFEPLSEGFRVVGATETMESSGTVPAIAMGTFVHMDYSCNVGPEGFRGDLVVIKNLATLEGKPNPTEGGERLWFAGASGGWTLPNDVLPFEPASTPTCMFGGGSSAGDIDISADATVMTLDLKGPGFSVSIDPGQEETFTATSGPQAGSYRAKNDQIEEVNQSGHTDPFYRLIFSIARAP